MATKIKSRTHTKGPVERVVEAAADAAQELGAAATSFKESWQHMSNARTKAKPATTAVKRAAKTAAKATTRAAKAVLPKRLTTKSKAAPRRKINSHKSPRGK